MRKLFPILATMFVATSLAGCSAFRDVTGSSGNPVPQAGFEDNGFSPAPQRRIRPLAAPPEPEFAASQPIEDNVATDEPAPAAAPVRKTKIRPIRPSAALAANEDEAPAAPEPEAEEPAPKPKKVQVAASGGVNANAALAQINAYREGKGLSPLKIDSALMKAAKQQSDAMAQDGSMSHTVGGSFAKRMARVGVTDVPAAENIAAGYKTSTAVIRGWRNSKAHDANLRMDEATRLGIAATPGADEPEKLYWTLIVAGDS
jgi:uncharacterized protein YkwD